MFPWRWTPRHGQGSENTFQQLGCGKVVDDIQSKCGPLKGSVPKESVYQFIELRAAAASSGRRK